MFFLKKKLTLTDEHLMKYLVLGLFFFSISSYSVELEKGVLRHFPAKAHAELRLLSTEDKNYLNENWSSGQQQEYSTSWKSVQSEMLKRARGKKDLEERVKQSELKQMNDCFKMVKREIESCLKIVTFKVIKGDDLYEVKACFDTHYLEGGDGGGGSNAYKCCDKVEAEHMTDCRTEAEKFSFQSFRLSSPRDFSACLIRPSLPFCSSQREKEPGKPLILTPNYVQTDETIPEPPSLKPKLGVFVDDSSREPKEVPLSNGPCDNYESLNAVGKLNCDQFFKFKSLNK